MNIESVAEELRALIIEFIGFKDYSDTGISKLRNLEASIIGFSKTPNCLSVCLYILEKQVVPQIQYFGSMLLKDKLKYDFEQIDPSNILQTHRRICQIIKIYRQPTTIVMINLCLCLIYIYMHCSGSMGDPLQYLHSSIKSVNPNYVIKCLEMLPEQIESSKVVIDDDVRNNTCKILQQNQRNILVEIGKSVDQMWKNKLIKKNILLCLFNNWVSFFYDSQLISNLAHHPLLAKALQSMSDPILSDQACQCVVGILNTIQSPKQDMQLFTYLSEVINLLNERVVEFIKDGEIQIAQNYIKILCEFGNKAKQVFITNYNQKIQRFLQILLSFMNNEQLNCFSIMFQFWVGFTEQVTKHPIEQIKGLLIKLFSNTLQRIPIPMKYLNDLNTKSITKLCNLHKEMQDLIQRRQEAQDLFECISKVVGKEVLVSEVIQNLQNMNQKNQNFWSTLEANIFALSSFIENYPSLSNEIILLLKSYEDLKPQYIAVQRSYLRFFRGLMSIRQKDVMFIQQLFVYIGAMFSLELLSQKAEKAFQKACQENPKIVCTNINDFLTLLSQHSEKRGILKGVLGILNSDQVLMKQYIAPIMNLYLQKIKMNKSKGEQKQGINSLTLIIKTITKPSSEAYEESVKALFVQVWPIIKQSFLFPKDLVDDEDPHIERCVKLLKMMMRCIKGPFTMFLQEVFQTATQAYNKYPICSYLYLLQVSITVYYQFAQFLDFFRTLYCTFCDITFNHITNREKIEKYQFLVDDFIGMNKRFFIYNAEIVLKTNKISLLLDLVELCCGCDVSKVAKASYQFIQVLYAFNWNQKMIQRFNAEEDHQPIKITKQTQYLYHPLKQVILKRTEMLLMKMLNDLSKCPLQQTADAILDALIAEIKAFPFQNSLIWGNLLSSIPEDILTKKEKDKFLGFLPKFSGKQQEQAQSEACKMLRIINKRFKNRKKRENLN